MDVTVYSICFGAGFLFAIVTAIFGHLFGGHDAHMDSGSGGHAETGFQDQGMPGMSIFSPTAICCFVTAFGGFGLILSKLEITRSPWISAPLAVIGAVVVAAAVIALFNAIFKRTQSSSESRVGELLGMAATVISPIPAEGVGEIAYVQCGTRYTAPARDDNAQSIAAGQSVRIVRIVGPQFFVSSI
jgi:membrane protein implicated in regulation of membrane protease activity